MTEVVVAAGICCTPLYSAFRIRGRFRNTNIILYFKYFSIGTITSTP